MGNRLCHRSGSRILSTNTAEQVRQALLANVRISRERFAAVQAVLHRKPRPRNRNSATRLWAADVRPCGPAMTADTRLLASDGWQATPPWYNPIRLRDVARLHVARSGSVSVGRRMPTYPVGEQEGDTVSAESSLALLERAQAGDAEALDTLLARYRPRLRRWAHRRLPDWARDLADTDDLVQVTLIKTIRNLAGFKTVEGAGMQNYLRTALANAVRDEIRKARNRPPFEMLDPMQPSDAPSALERAVGRRRLARYETALSQLSREEREAIIARFEFGFTHGELAEALGKRTPDAARKLCQKAIARLLVLMDDLKPSAS